MTVPERHLFVSNRINSMCGEQLGNMGVCDLGPTDDVHFPIIKPMEKRTNGIPVRTTTLPLCMTGTCADDPTMAQEAEYLLPHAQSGGHGYLLVCGSHASDWWGGDGITIDMVPLSYFLHPVVSIGAHFTHLGYEAR